MTEYIEICWTTGSIDEARKISRYLVLEARLVACAQLIPWIESIFMWNNQLETVQETKVVFKAKLDDFEKIKNIILENCSYDLPEITYSIIHGGHQEYLEWIKVSTPNFMSSEVTDDKIVIQK